MGSASMSALRPTVGPSPSPSRVATTPFSATLVCISRGRPSSAASTLAAVFSVSKPSSGSLWISLLRATIFSPKPSRTSLSRPSNLWTTLISRSLPRGSLSLQRLPRSAVVAPHDEIVHMPLAISEQAVLRAYADVLRPQPQGGRTSRGFLFGPLLRAQFAAGSRVPVRGGDPVRRQDRGPDLRPRAVAGVQMTGLTEPC